MAKLSGALEMSGSSSITGPVNGVSGTLCTATLSGALDISGSSSITVTVNGVRETPSTRVGHKSKKSDLICFVGGCH